jgi:FkbH-like protein
MVLREANIAAFQINWDDKAANLKRIASDLKIGLDAIVFVDDNPFERNIVRREIPEVSVPELPEDPALWSSLLSSAGYFESVGITTEDLNRSGSYQASRALRTHGESETDLRGYLASLNMHLSWGTLDPLSLKRVTQLINKTNQFNLTTKRYTDGEMAALMHDPNVAVLHFRLRDKYADHGIISVVIVRCQAHGTLEIDSWLMSCRVLGRQVEQAVFCIVAEVARRRECQRIIGRYSATAKNGMVRDHYAGLGFQKADESGAEVTWVARTPPHADAPEIIDIEEASS